MSRIAAVRVSRSVVPALRGVHQVPAHVCRPVSGESARRMFESGTYNGARSGLQPAGGAGPCSLAFSLRLPVRASSLRGLELRRAKSSSRPDARAEDAEEIEHDIEDGSTVLAAAAAAAMLQSSEGTRPTDPLGSEPANKSPAVGEIPGGDNGLEGAGLSDRMRERLSACGIEKLFPVQRATFAALMTGKDMLVKARTGSGKTIGFALPIIEKIMAARAEVKSSRGRAPQAVILAPTRELAMQIQREFVRLDRAVTAVCIYGGAPSYPQEKALHQGVDVVVGTPGRVIDMLERGALKMQQVKVFVLDEADEMLKMGFQDDVERIMEELPEERQMNLWSATQPRWIMQMAHKYCRNLEKIDLVGGDPVRTAATIRHIAVATPWDLKGAMVANFVRAHATGKRVLVFCNTKMDVESMAASDDLKGMARVIHGDVNQQQRERTLNDFRAGLFTVLVATDVAARGIDVPEVALVVQTKMPEDDDTFVHRSGRTGRAGRQGLNLVLYSSGEERKLLALEKDVGIKFDLVGSPSMKEVLASREEEMRNLLDVVPPGAVDNFRYLAKDLNETRGADALAAALALLAGFKTAPRRYSLLAGRPNYVTMQLDLSPKLARNVRGVHAVRRLLEQAYAEVQFSSLGKIVGLKGGSTYLLDMDEAELAKLVPRATPNEDIDSVQEIASESQRGVTLRLVKELPPLKELVETMRSDGNGNRHGGGGYGGRSSGRHGGYGGGGGYGRGRQGRNDLQPWGNDQSWGRGSGRYHGASRGYEGQARGGGGEKRGGGGQGGHGGGYGGRGGGGGWGDAKAPRVSDWGR